MGSTPVKRLCLSLYTQCGAILLGYSCFPSFLQEKELYPHLLQFKCLSSPLATYRFCRSSGSPLFKSLPVCFIYHLFTAGRKIFLSVKADAFTLTPLLQVFIFSAVWPQDFRSVVTPNKQPNCQSSGPARPSLLPEVSFADNERLELVWHTSFISPTPNIPNQKRS